MKNFLNKLWPIIPTFIGISILAFLLVRFAPGDPVLLLAGERGVSPERYLELMREFGLDKPIWEQYWQFVTNFLSGDLGTSIRSKIPVWDEFVGRFPATLELSLVAIVLAIGIGIPIGVFAAVKRNTWVDYSLMGSALVGYSMPIFWWALLMILFFSNWLDLTPVSGRLGIEYDIEPVTGLLLIDCWLTGEEDAWPAFLSAVHHLVLPGIVLATIPLAIIARMTRSAMLEVLGQDYIKTAYAKGLSPAQVIFKHALKNALIPVVTVIGLQVSVLLTGAILTESIFSWPGIGKWVLEAIHQRDYPVVQSAILLIAMMVVAVNIVVDIVYTFINPKMRSSR